MLQCLRDEAAEQRTQCRRQRAGHRIPRENFRPGCGRNDVGQSGLFDRQKRADFIAAWADDTDGAREDQKNQIASASEG